MIDANIPVTEVRVLEDRASVRRRGSVELPAGRSKVSIRDVAPVLADKTLSITVEGGALQNSRVRRKSLPKRDEREGKHADLVRSLADARENAGRVRAKLARVAEELGATQTTRSLLIADIGDDVAWGRATPDEWKDGFVSSTERDAALAVEAAKLHKEAERLEREVQDLARREALARTPSSTRTAWIELDIIMDAAGSVSVGVEYLVPGACWRPQHRATLRDGRLTMETDASVWQCTGEDWTEVSLSFSTERPSLGVEPPSLHADLVRTKKKAEVMEVETREQTVETTGLGSSRSVADELPGVDDGGEPRTLRAPKPATVPTDGRPYRVRLSDYTVDAERSLVAFPELTLAVIARSRHEHEGVAPLLAGPVDLIGQSGPVGRTSTLFVAPKETYELGWGPDPAIRISRESEVKEGKSKMLSSWIRTRHRVSLKLSNTGGETCRIEVTERVPVSEVAQVEIEVDAKETTQGSLPDQDGFIRWQVELGPHARESIELAYTVSKKEGVRGI